MRTMARWWEGSEGQGDDGQRWADLRDGWRCHDCPNEDAMRLKRKIKMKERAIDRARLTRKRWDLLSKPV
jgi:hypothetical protein